MPLNENVENLVEKLLEEELIKLMAEEYDDDDADEYDLDGGEEIMGVIKDELFEEDGLGLNKAKVAILTGEKISQKPQEKPMFLVGLTGTEDNVKNTA